ncbi:hypothetical protein HYW76_02935 [Candidatus Pacearchaeota archaeon]|nr:hypothetical protein [Candidatus Pacearchaeota archaeon]
MKVIIFDSSTIINFALNGILNVLEELKNIFPGKFIITGAVAEETVDKPINNIKKYELEALQIKRLYENGVFEYPESLNISSKEIKIKTAEILDETNHAFLARNNFMHIIDEGEASCIALSLICKERGIENVIAVDERTTRVIIENIENMRKLFEKKLHTKVVLKKRLEEFREIKCIRSAELAYIAWKKKIVNLGNGRALDALLYATKFRGCSISYEEIEEIKKLPKRVGEF